MRKPHPPRLVILFIAISLVGPIGSYSLLKGGGGGAGGSLGPPLAVENFLSVGA